VGQGVGEEQAARLWMWACISQGVTQAIWFAAFPASQNLSKKRRFA